ncbi:hypothetical protein [Streptomyces sp. NPDC005485]|uniref:hypothetical protein n=1 Tax=Streptomyces sp. NPDC005485 TaxID=3155591 RepID=UPI0033AA658C
MASPMHVPEAQHEAGDAWLADCAEQPDLVREAWDVQALATIRTGVHWLAAESPIVAVLAALKRMPPGRLGPVLADPTTEQAWWLVPLGAGEHLAGTRQIRVRPAGWPLRCPPTGWQLCGRFWLQRPDGSGKLTDPVLLGAALGPEGSGPRLPAEAFG